MNRLPHIASPHIPPIVRLPPLKAIRSVWFLRHPDLLAAFACAAIIDEWRNFSEQHSSTILYFFTKLLSLVKVCGCCHLVLIITYQLCCDWLQLKVALVFSLLMLTNVVTENGVMDFTCQCSLYKMQRNVRKSKFKLELSLNFNQYIHMWPLNHAWNVNLGPISWVNCHKWLALMRQRQFSHERMNSRPLRRLSCWGFSLRTCVCAWAPTAAPSDTAAVSEQPSVMHTDCICTHLRRERRGLRQWDKAR